MDLKELTLVPRVVRRARMQCCEEVALHAVKIPKCQHCRASRGLWSNYRGRRRPVATSFYQLRNNISARRQLRAHLSVFATSPSQTVPFGRTRWSPPRTPDTTQISPIFIGRARRTLTTHFRSRILLDKFNLLFFAVNFVHFCYKLRNKQINHPITTLFTFFVYLFVFTFFVYKILCQNKQKNNLTTTLITFFVYLFCLQN